MDDENARRQRNPPSYPYLNQFTDTMLNGQAALDADMDAVWKSFELQIPQCIGPENTFDCFRTSHDDLCAYPPKCPTTTLLGSTTSAPSHMLFHTRHYPPQAAGLHQKISPHAAGGLDFFHGAPSTDAHPVFTSAATGTPFGHAVSGSPATSGGGYTCFDQDDFVDQLSALSSPPHNPVADVECDNQSVCDSDCGDGEICHESICSDDPSACCEDETCLQSVPSAAAADVSLTSEDAIAAAALASFVGQSIQLQQQQQQQQQQPQPQHQQALQQSFIAPPGPGFVMGPDSCISPQFLMNYQHLREAHNPLQPTSCRASFCPIEDPSFYAECHIKHVEPQHQASYFDNIDLNMMLAGDNSLDASHECDAKFPNVEAMVQHFWTQHRVCLPDQLQQLPVDSMHSHVPGLASSTASTVSLSSQEMMPTPSLALSDDSPPLDPKFDFDSTIPKDEYRQDTECPLLLLPGREAEDTQHVPQRHECFWCDAVGASPCGQVFDSASDLHRHTIEAHTHQLKRDVGGTYSCGWFGCNRRDCEEKGGFAQKSKIDRHMQVHTGNKPFLCGICGQSFSANQALVQHKLIHADIKPLSCEICGKTFRQHSALTMHIRTHTKVRPLKCPYCSKEFSESSNLSKHKRIHTGDGLYICQYPGCGKHFHRKDQLRRHGTQHRKSRADIQSPAALAAALADTA